MLPIQSVTPLCDCWLHITNSEGRDDFSFAAQLLNFHSFIYFFALAVGGNCLVFKKLKENINCVMTLRVDFHCHSSI